MIDNAWRVFRYGWSIRWIAISGLFSFLEVFLNIFSTNVNEPGYIDILWWSVPVGTFAAMAALSSTLAAITRFIAQEKVSGNKT
jgi:hypothetical protein